MTTSKQRPISALALGLGLLSIPLAACDAEPGDGHGLEARSELDLLGEADVASLEETLDHAGVEVLGEELVCTDWDTTTPAEPCVEWTDLEADLEIGLAPQASEPQPGPCTEWVDCLHYEDLGVACPPPSSGNIFAQYCRECQDCGSGPQCGDWWFLGYTCARG
jgi:hypothetical protein